MKLDPDFAAGIGAPVLHSILALAKSRGVVVVAEGVETEEQLHGLHERGCRVVQGFVVARPLPKDEVTALFDPNAAWRRRLGPA